MDLQQLLQNKEPWQIAAAGGGLGFVVLTLCCLLYALCCRRGSAENLDNDEGDQGELERQEILADVYGHSTVDDDADEPILGEDKTLDNAWEAIQRAASSSDEGDLLGDGLEVLEHRFIQVGLPDEELNFAEAARKQAQLQQMRDLLDAPSPPSNGRSPSTQPAAKGSSQVAFVDSKSVPSDLECFGL
mmetsp:Transcript_36248/g.82109  ORF Transcript_36248/g.82109 Transcript_36248/m.82109 type:complete len:188 (+) Transcript_36248:82-645(+)